VPRDLQKTSPALGSQAYPGGVVERRDRIEQSRPCAGGAQPGERAFERVDVETLFAERYADHLDGVIAQDAEREVVGGRLHEDDVARRSEDGEHQVERLGVPAADEDLVRREGAAFSRRETARDLLAQRRRPLRLSVGERPGAGLGEHAIRGGAHQPDRQHGRVGLAERELHHVVTERVLRVGRRCFHDHMIRDYGAWERAACGRR